MAASIARLVAASIRRARFELGPARGNGVGDRVESEGGGTGSG